METRCPIRRIIKRNGSIVPYKRSRIANAILKATASVGPPDPRLAKDVAARVERALISTYGSGTMPSVEEIQDVVESVLMESRHAAIARSYIIYRHQRAMARAARDREFEVTDNVPYRKLYEVLRWNVEHECESADSLNRLVHQGRLPELIEAADRRLHDEIRAVACRIADGKGRVRVVIVAGPSSSGKTTTTIKLGEVLRKYGLRFKAVNVDHYFFELGRHPRDEFGDYDYETPAALDMDLINRHLALLLDGREIRTPHYDFKSGARRLDVHPMRLAKNEILLIDSLHGLYEAMTRSVSPQRKFRLYVETLGQFRGGDGTLMRWADNRLLRRMIRDRDHRNLRPIQTLTHWHYVRRSELKDIIPFIQRSDGIVNTALPYELPILKSKLFRYISAAVDRYADDPKRLDAHIRVNRIYDLLDSVRAVRDDSCVPADSLLREFIGGSRYRY